MTETETPTIEQIERADYLELQGMAKAAGLKANESGDELRAALRDHYHAPAAETGAEGAPETTEAPEEPQTAADPETSPQAAVETHEGTGLEELHTWRAVSTTMTRDGRRTIPAGSTFVATESDPRTRDAVKVEPEGLTDAQLAALASAD